MAYPEVHRGPRHAAHRITSRTHRRRHQTVDPPLGTTRPHPPHRWPLQGPRRARSRSQDQAAIGPATMPRALSVCSTPTCPELTNRAGRCDNCRRVADKRRGTASERGYNKTHWQVRRRACLRRDLFCVCTDTGHAHGTTCMAPTTVADHYPTSRRDLVAMGVTDPDALIHLRGLCSSCHNRSTAIAQPGGWNAASSR